MKLSGELIVKLSISAAENYHLVYSGSGDLAAVRAAAVDHTLGGIVAVFGIEIDDALRADIESKVDFKLAELESRRKKRRA